MKSRVLGCVSAMTLFAALAIPIRLPAQDDADHASKPKHHHYKLIDMGTFGGPDSTAGAVNSRGIAMGWSATSAPTSPTSNPLICGGIDGVVPFITHTFRWNGAVMDLGALSPNDSNCSEPTSINAKGEIAGISENGEFDPLTGFNSSRAVVWEGGQLIDLGSFGGNQNAAFGINNRGQVVGNSLNTIPDLYCFFGTVQMRAFLWEHGDMLDLGTLGGNCAQASYINDRGQITGFSYTNMTANASTGIPTQDPFLWERGKMIDIGTLGGVFGGAGPVNNRGQVIGVSSIGSDPGACNGFPDNGDFNCHPFLWDQGNLIDLGTSTIGGRPLDVASINDAGLIVGVAAFPNAPFDAFLWRKGVATDLGHLNDCFSVARVINSHDQVIAGTFSCDGTNSRPLLWENGASVDLNTLISPHSSLELVDAGDINDRGEISGVGVPAGVLPANVATQGHAFLLIPCDENHPQVEGCDYSLVEGSATAASSTPAGQRPTIISVNAASRRQMMRLLGRRWMRWYRSGEPAPTEPNAGVSQLQKFASNTISTSTPIVALSPTSLSFPTQAIDTTSSAKMVALKNTGTASLTITAIAIVGINAADFAQAHTCGSSLAAGASCRISVTFRPTASGTRTAALSISDNAAGSPQKVSLSGIGTTAKLSPMSLNFRTVALGDTSSSKAVTLTNVGTTTLTISGVAITGTNAEDFNQTRNCGSSLAAGASCDVSITFKPPDSGTRAAALSISDNAAGSPQKVTLSGNGTTAKLYPPYVNFGSVTIGTTSSPQIVTLTNVGVSTLTIIGIAISGTDPGDFAQTHTCGTSLAAGASCNITVTFKPTASGTRTAVVSISDNAAGSPQSVSLFGTGIAGRCTQYGGECGTPFTPRCCAGLTCSYCGLRDCCL